VYDEKRFPHMAFVACSEIGATDLQLAHLFNVSKTTITMWKREYPEFLTSIKDGKDIWDCATAENCLQKRVKGYEYTETTSELVPVTREVTEYDENGVPTITHIVESEMTVNKKVVKQVAPDTKAIEFFLTNRNPARWRRIKHVELTGSDGGPVRHSMDPWSDIVKEVTGENDDILPNTGN